jgi:biopolymer transport protein ExbD/biopolymer transport protein TolR
MSEINVTPLVDVVLVLLIIFMVTAPILQTGIEVNLPQTRTVSAIDPEQRAVITISREEMLFYRSNPVNFNELGEWLRREIGDSGEAGYEQINLVTKPYLEK